MCPFVLLSVYIYSIVTVVDDVFRPIISVSACIRPCFPSSVCLSIRTYVRACNRPFVRLSVCIYSIVTVVDDVFRPIISASVCIRPCFPSFVCLSIRAYVRACIRLSVRLSVYIYSIVAVVDDILSSSFSITEMSKIVLIKPFGCRMKTFHIRLILICACLVRMKRFPHE